MAPAEPSIRQRPPAVLTALRIYCLLLLGLYLLTPLLTEETAWGLWPVTYLPPVWRWCAWATRPGFCRNCKPIPWTPWSSGT